MLRLMKLGILILLCVCLFGWRRDTGEYLKKWYKPGGETIISVESGGLTSGAGIRGRRSYVVHTNTGAVWKLRVRVLYQVLPGQIGPACMITGVDSILAFEASGAPPDIP